ncbi:hypothetical protein Np050604_097 [Cyanophage S-RIM44]|uniref:Uncharacterized protein n=2 Tax=Vellamovirus TaxID=2733139 RepID=A0A127KN13_9CAUD|nr:virion structural protein [Prochlorococcus phage Syn1]AMO43341.1 hypothetical protein W270710_097 [Cyanophage S-RIM44]ADO99199.1 hypothetical protein Syn1_098 [Prochlorococcus phage Syn1]AOO11813.1 hypothetical protein Np050604_097 [Cyanophage S-RIM44]AOO12514.1 hypothetical protein Sn080709_097 [Cyanophage S-RIM44]AOO12980.1 hypothetical protein W2100709_098 [Cyanophage S-RIM44]
MIKVQGHENLYRDPNTGAIVNKQLPHKRSASQTISAMKSDINTLKEELSDIKQLLREIVKNASS